MTEKCKKCGHEHECRRETCRRCGGFGMTGMNEPSTTDVNSGPRPCDRCGGDGYEPDLLSPLNILPTFPVNY